MGWKGILGFEYGIVQAPLGPDISGPELVAAVANAGAIGILRAPDWESPHYLRELIRKTRTLTDKPFGVGIVLAFPHEQNLKCVLEEKVAILQLYWGEVTKDIIGSFEEAQLAADAGVDAIIVQGHEAGGHVIGQEALIALVPRIVDLVASRGIPVIAAGGIVDERGYVAALALGAKGVCLGTRFLATEESNAHPMYKRKVVEMNKTEYTNVFGRARWPGAPHRVLKTPFFMKWRNLPSNENEANQPEKDIRVFAGTVPNKTTTGDIESMVMYAGEGVGLINDILPAAQVVKRFVEGAQILIQQNFTS
ncbi:2-nitropropane dioxygenase, NPD [Cynara cardunculus var. scolymus]|uniref:2-nitropropane dioxygenase, NPD n=1 Tax=Cynara cardunculus var. scolymus TaxID=59895 RepID=A0A118JVC2_CYNCS|nr:2-nitropropane dioxygenase, NPD [Cynara cardunculus var. scolymus]